MADIDRLIEEFAAAYEAGRAVDPAELLGRVDAGQRQELAERIDNYLMTAPARRWDPEAFEGSLAQLASDRVYESIEGVSGSWPELLPRLRERARIKRRELVERLARGLGFGSEPEIARIGDYYNRMEHGLLPAAGVSHRVIAELAGLLGVEPERIAGAGGRPTGSAGGGEVAFARRAFPDAELAAPEEQADMDMAPPAERAEYDEIDALFLGG